MRRIYTSASSSKHSCPTLVLSQIIICLLLATSVNRNRNVTSSIQFQQYHLKKGLKIYSFRRQDFRPAKRVSTCFHSFGFVAYGVFKVVGQLSPLLVPHSAQIEVFVHAAEEPEGCYCCNCAAIKYAATLAVLVWSRLSCSFYHYFNSQTLVTLASKIDLHTHICTYHQADLSMG